MRLGRYELISRLATGGMGEVFLARRRGPGDIEKRVVIKRIRPDLSGDPRFVEMFLREARLSMTLSHKNIATVFDFGRAGPALFIAMEHVDGRDLARALRAARAADATLSPTAVAHIGIEVCQALDYAHRTAGSEPIIHRDLSPKNLLVSFSGEIVVADFGLAIAAGEQLAKAGVRGTPAYLSPEQARGEPVDARSDLFALGLVLHEALGGEAAYRGDSPVALIELAKRAEVPALSDDLPPALRTIVEKATEADPAARFQSARQMQLALDEYTVASRAGGASPPGIEIASWLTALFDGDEGDASSRIGYGDVGAVTFLDDGPEAVEKGARDISEVSSAVTVGDSAVEAAPKRPHSASRKRPVVALLVVAMVAAAVIGGVTLARRGNAPATPDAAPPVLDASTPSPTDAAIDATPRPTVDAATPTADASPEAQAPTFGWVRVQSRPWARVTVSRSGKRCPETPCRLRLRTGTHTLRLVNPVTGAKASRKVEIVADTTVDISVALPPPP